MVPRSHCPPLREQFWLNQNPQPEEEWEAACVLSTVLVGRVLLKLWATLVTGVQLPGTFLLFDSSVC